MTTQTIPEYGPFLTGGSTGSGGPGAGEVRGVHDKTNGALLARVQDADPATCDRAVGLARAAQPRWEDLPVTERGAVLRRAAGILEGRRDELVDLLIRESGGTRGKAVGEVATSIGELELAAALALTVEGSILPSGAHGRTNLIERRAVGVLGLITAWNYPMHLAFRVMAPALALGNAVLLKPAPATPLMGGLAWADALAEAGLPAGVLGVLPGEVAGPELVRHGGVDMVHFTGSTQVGRWIAREAGAGLKKVALELGGSNATVVLADADIRLAASKGAVATYVHQGQVCIATSRHIVVRSVAEEYTAALAAHAGRLVVGDPTASTDVDLGPLVSRAQADRVRAAVADAVSAGADVVVGGDGDGAYLPAMVVTGVPTESALFRDETFGPVAAVVVAEDEDDAVRLANLTSFGLSAAVFTQDVGRGWQVARRIRAGMVHVNDMTALHESHIPFGGLGSSGLGGRFGGSANVELLTEPRWISLQQF